MKLGIFILVFSLVMALLTACQSVAPVTTTRAMTPQVPITQATTTQPSVTSTFTSSWATNQTMTYLYSLATSPAALRYLSDLLSQTTSQTNYSGWSQKNDTIMGHRSSGWKVQLTKSSSSLSRDYWSDLNWGVCQDGYVVELPGNALKVKADLLELNNK